MFLSGSVWDPAFSGYPTHDPLLLTIDWGDGTPVFTKLFTDPSLAGFSEFHTYNLPADQLIGITVTVDDGDGGTDSESFSLAYDDILTITNPKGLGAEGGLLHFRLNAQTEIGAIAAHAVDLLRDGGTASAYQRC